jgi:hypothetical protein
MLADFLMPCALYSLNIALGHTYRRNCDARHVLISIYNHSVEILVTRKCLWYCLWVCPRKLEAHLDNITNIYLHLSA